MGSVVFTDAFTQSYIGYGSYDVKVDFSETYNQAANKTTVKITGIAIRKNNNSANYGSMPVYGSIKVGGTTLVTVNGSPAYAPMDGTVYRSVTGFSSSSVDIQHNADGSANTTFQLVAGITANGVAIFGAALLRAAFGSRAASKSVALTTHPRISSVSATDAYIGEPVTITLSRHNSAFTHTVKVTCAGNTETLMTKGSTYPTLSWTPALATYAPLITNGMAATATITCETYNGDTLIGQSTTTCTLTLKTADVAPSVAIATSDPTGNLTTYGKFVKTKSKIQVTATPTLLQGATLASTSITANDATYNESPATTDFITSASNTNVSARITDSRGQSASASASIQIYDYEAPQIVAMAAHRCNSDGTDNNAGAYFKVDYSVAITALGNHNSKSLKVKYKKRSASTYSEQTFSLSAYTVTSATPAIAVDTNSTYDVIVELSDDFSSASYSLTLPTATTRMNWRQGVDGGIAIGKVCEHDKTLEVASDWTVDIGGDLSVGDDASVVGDLSVGGDLSVTGDLDLTGSLTSPLPVASGGTGADNAASARANLGAIHGLGDVENNQSFPFTATADGVLYFSFSANSSSSNSYVYLKEENVFNTNIFHAVSMGGAAIVDNLIIKSGWKISVNYTSNATFSWLKFVPFE